jgi:GTP-binding protein
VRVPPGTEITTEDGEVHDLTVPGQRVTVAVGGPGGRGNRRFKGATHQSPRFAEKGLVGHEGWLDLRLKLLADVGLVGLPNAGKSSLITRMTRAVSKVADYPFTTLEPVLGTLEGEDRQLVLADIPGLIEGAAGGAGLGHDFLAHVERTRLLVHVLDLAPLDGSNPVENFATIERELETYDPRLAGLPRIIVLSKADLVSREHAAAAKAAWEERLAPEPVGEWEDAPEPTPVLVTSAATFEGLEELKALLLRRVPRMEAPVPVAGLGDGEALAEHRTFRPAGRTAPFTVEAAGEHLWRVQGDAVERLVARHDLENQDALIYVEHRLHRMGVMRALESEGFEPGDDIEIAGVVFELDA